MGRRRKAFKEPKQMKEFRYSDDMVNHYVLNKDPRTGRRIERLKPKPPSRRDLRRRYGRKVADDIIKAQRRNAKEQR